MTTQQTAPADGDHVVVVVDVVKGLRSSDECTLTFCCLNTIYKVQDELVCLSIELSELLLHFLLMMTFIFF